MAEKGWGPRFIRADMGVSMGQNTFERTAQCGQSDGVGGGARDPHRQVVEAVGDGVDLSVGGREDLGVPDAKTRSAPLSICKVPAPATAVVSVSVPPLASIVPLSSRNGAVTAP